MKGKLYNTALLLLLGIRTIAQEPIEELTKIYSKALIENSMDTVNACYVDAMQNCKLWLTMAPELCEEMDTLELDWERLCKKSHLNELQKQSNWYTDFYNETKEWRFNWESAYVENVSWVDSLMLTAKIKNTQFAMGAMILDLSDEFKRFSMTIPYAEFPTGPRLIFDRINWYVLGNIRAAYRIKERICKSPENAFMVFSFSYKNEYGSTISREYCLEVDQLTNLMAEGVIRIEGNPIATDNMNAMNQICQAEYLNFEMVDSRKSEDDPLKFIDYDHAYYTERELLMYSLNYSHSFFEDDTTVLITTVDYFSNSYKEMKMRAHLLNECGFLVWRTNNKLPDLEREFEGTRATIMNCNRAEN